MSNQESTGNEVKDTKEAAANRGEQIIYHLKEIYKLVEWNDDENAYIRTALYKSGKIEVASHLDDDAGYEPTIFEIEAIEKAQAEAEDKE